MPRSEPEQVLAEDLLASAGIAVDAHREAPDSDHVGASLSLVPDEPCEGDLVLSGPPVRAPA